MTQTGSMIIVCLFAAEALAQTDPGFRTTGGPKSGSPISNLSPAEAAFFLKAKDVFQEQDGVPQGLGPRFNLDSCSGCHAHPAVGGSSPPVNPQIAVATRLGANNRIPSFLSSNGPVREVRFKHNPDGSADGGVHDIFTITGRSDAPPTCRISQPDFSATQNLSFRIPTPAFGLGLIEAIPDSTLRNSLATNSGLKRAMGISGRFNTSGNDGTITRFGWKAQNKSLEIFSGEAYNVEVGVTNDLFPQEREETAACLANATPESHADLTTGTFSDVAMFSIFMRFLAPPTPDPPTAASTRGQALFMSIGCALCHTPSLKTGRSSTAALSNRDAPLFSDLALHNMGDGLNDGVSQGGAQPSEFRTAPLWGLGDRIFLLHDGRAASLPEAISAHSSDGSEANAVIRNYNALRPAEKQDLLTFLRSL